MCGRVRLSNDHSEIKIKLNAADLETPALQPNYNAAPSQLLPVIRQYPETGKRTIRQPIMGLNTALDNSP
jgi:putative SOS response-associated peptidase YedK